MTSVGRIGEEKVRLPIFVVITDGNSTPGEGSADHLLETSGRVPGVLKVDSAVARVDFHKTTSEAGEATRRKQQAGERKRLHDGKGAKIIEFRLKFVHHNSPANALRTAQNSI